jgi:hypothetical protein
MPLVKFTWQIVLRTTFLCALIVVIQVLVEDPFELFAEILDHEHSRRFYKGKAVD